MNITGTATYPPSGPSQVRKKIVPRHSANTFEASFNPIATMSDSNGRRISRSSASRTGAGELLARMLHAGEGEERGF